MRLLDLFCGAGGCTKGYQRAGAHVTGIDIRAQPNYCGDDFIQADALDVESVLDLACFDAIHASPPCQAHSDLQRRSKRDYPELVGPTRELLIAIGKPYVIENVEGAPLHNPVVLCGTMFPGLRVIRHRLFETNWPLVVPHCRAHPLVLTHDKRKAHYGALDQDRAFVQVTGGGNATIANKRSAMGIDWMTGAELNQAIPPAYTEFVGRRLAAFLESTDNQRTKEREMQEADTAIDTDEVLKAIRAMRVSLSELEAMIVPKIDPWQEHVRFMVETFGRRDPECRWCGWPIYMALQGFFGGGIWTTDASAEGPGGLGGGPASECAKSPTGGHDAARSEVAALGGLLER